ncbi:DUF4199 domain-containing protein [Aquimarina litoralis]|uniref:DUF4199 domain-containing protein n=1 Tax=Aquimarina litoralis TaxID=584605 RepID=UPI001C58768D|nr:DUF4199 domain-containing protein [Aquimarina litoralis]
MKKLIEKHGFTFGIISMLIFSILTSYMGLTVRNHLFQISILILTIVFVFMLRLIQFKKHILKYGVILGVATVIYTLSFKLLDESGIKFTRTRLFVLLFITIGSILLGLQVFKKNNDGYISLKEVLKISIGISLMGGLVAVLWRILRIHVIDTEFIDQVNENNFKRMLENSIEFTQKDIDRRMAIIKRMNSPLRMISRRMAEHLGHGIVIGYVLGLFIRKKKKESLT